MPRRSLQVIVRCVFECKLHGYILLSNPEKIIGKFLPRNIEVDIEGGVGRGSKTPPTWVFFKLRSVSSRTEFFSRIFPKGLIMQQIVHLLADTTDDANCSFLNTCGTYEIPTL
jgi:hypothetical protein